MSDDVTSAVDPGDLDGGTSNDSSGTGTAGSAERADRADRRGDGRRRDLVAALFVAASLAVFAPVAVVAWQGDRGSASFGDQESVGRNRIGAATVDLEVGERTTPLRATDLAPGDLVTGEIELVNAGTVALRYAVTVAVEGSGPLGPWLGWRFLPVAGTASCPDEAEWRAGVDGAVAVPGDRLDQGEVAVLGNPAPGAHDGDRILGVGGSERLCVAVVVDIEAPNSVQDSTTEVRITANGEQLTKDDAASPEVSAP